MRNECSFAQKIIVVKEEDKQQEGFVNCNKMASEIGFNCTLPPTFCEQCIKVNDFEKPIEQATILKGMFKNIIVARTVAAFDPRFEKTVPFNKKQMVVLLKKYMSRDEQKGLISQMIRHLSLKQKEKHQQAAEGLISFCSSLGLNEYLETIVKEAELK